MTLSVRLSSEEVKLLNLTARRLGRSKSDLARQAVKELCQKLAQEEYSPYSIGLDLFGAGELAEPPSDSLKQQVWEKLSEKHRHMG